MFIYFYFEGRTVVSTDDVIVVGGPDLSFRTYELSLAIWRLRDRNLL